MKILAIDTATEACSAALWLDNKVHARFEVAGRDHTRRLLPMVRALMSDAGVAFAQLDGIACGIGPGSFAGVRIGVGYVKGLALALDLPVVGVSSLAMLAQGAQREHRATQVLPVIDARMNEVYSGAYAVENDGLMRSLRPEAVSAPRDLPAPSAGQWFAAGSGWGAYREALLEAAADTEIVEFLPDALPRAEDALTLVLPEFRAGRVLNADALAPAYLRDKVALTLAEQAALQAGALGSGNRSGL